MHTGDSDEEQPEAPEFEEDDPSQASDPPREDVDYVRRDSRYGTGPIMLSPLTPTSSQTEQHTPTRTLPTPHPDYVQDPSRRPDIPWDTLTPLQRMDENDYRRAYVQWTRMRDVFKTIPQGFPVPPAHWPRPWCPLGTPLNYFLPRTDPWVVPSILVPDAPGTTGIEHIVLRTREPRRFRRAQRRAQRGPPPAQSTQESAQSFVRTPPPDYAPTHNYLDRTPDDSATDDKEHEHRQSTSASIGSPSTEPGRQDPTTGLPQESPISTFTLPIQQQVQTECLTPDPPTTSPTAPTIMTDSERRTRAIQELPDQEPCTVQKDRSIATLN